MATLALSLALPAGCSFADASRGPRLYVAATPRAAELFVDGQRVRDPRWLEHAYYGHRELRVLPPATLEDTVHLDVAERMVDVPPPVPKWLFPLDFVVECAIWPFTSIDDRSATLELPPSLERVLDDGAPPSGLDGLRERAKAARVARW